MEIVSMIKINGEWVDQKDIPPDVAAEIIEQTIRRAANNIGFDVKVKKKDKTA